MVIHSLKIHCIMRTQWMPNATKKSQTSQLVLHRSISLQMGRNCVSIPAVLGIIFYQPIVMTMYIAHSVWVNFVGGIAASWHTGLWYIGAAAAAVSWYWSLLCCWPTLGLTVLLPRHTTGQRATSVAFQIRPTLTLKIFRDELKTTFVGTPWQYEYISF